MNTMPPYACIRYLVQNCDFGTFLDIVDETGKGKKYKGHLVSRARKEGNKAQEWILLGGPIGDKWSIANYGSDHVYISTENVRPIEPNCEFVVPVVSYDKQTIPQAAYLSFGTHDEDPNIITIQIGGGILQTANGFDLKINPNEDEDDPRDRSKWKLIEVCPILSQDGRKYYIRGLSGRVLSVNSGSFLRAVVLSDSQADTNNKALWLIEPESKGQCIVKLCGRDGDTYLCTQDEPVNGQSNWKVAIGDRKYIWNLERIGELGYQLIMPPLTKSQPISFAVTIENDTDIILKENKAEHGQVLMMDTNYSVEETMAQNRGSLAGRTETRHGGTGFPTDSYFRIHERGTKNCLTLWAYVHTEGVQVQLWPLESAGNMTSQVFFIDETGALCHSASGLAVDIVDDVPILRRRRPHSTRPNPWSHPLPLFSYTNSQISIKFLSNPALPGCSDTIYSKDSWSSDVFVLATRSQKPFHMHPLSDFAPWIPPIMKDLPYETRSNQDQAWKVLVEPKSWNLCGDRTSWDIVPTS